MGFPGDSVGKESACNSGVCVQHMRYWFDPWVRKIPWRRKWLPTPVFLPGKSHGQKSMGLRRVRHDLATNTFTVFLISTWHITMFLKSSNNGSNVLSSWFKGSLFFLDDRKFWVTKIFPRPRKWSPYSEKYSIWGNDKRISSAISSFGFSVIILWLSCFTIWWQKQNSKLTKFTKSAAKYACICLSTVKERANKLVTWDLVSMFNNAAFENGQVTYSAQGHLPSKWHTWEQNEIVEFEFLVFPTTGPAPSNKPCEVENWGSGVLGSWVHILTWQRGPPCLSNFSGPQFLCL